MRVLGHHLVVSWRVAFMVLPHGGVLSVPASSSLPFQMQLTEARFGIHCLRESPIRYSVGGSLPSASLMASALMSISISSPTAGMPVSSKS